MDFCSLTILLFNLKAIRVLNTPSLLLRHVVLHRVQPLPQFALVEHDVGRGAPRGHRHFEAAKSSVNSAAVSILLIYIVHSQ